MAQGRRVFNPLNFLGTLADQQVGRLHILTSDLRNAAAGQAVGQIGRWLDWPFVEDQAG